MTAILDTPLRLPTPISAPPAPRPGPTGKQRAFAWARTLGGVAILAVLVWRLGTSAFLDGLRVINVGTLLAAFAIGVAGTVASAWRWCLAARGLGIDLPLRTAVADYYQALFLNATLPGGLLGDVDRAVRNGRESGDIGRGVRAVMLERFAGQATLFLVGFGVLLAHPSLFGTAARLNPVPPAWLAAVGAALLAVAVVAAFRWRRSTARWRRALGTIAGDVRQGLLSRRNLPGILISSALVLGSHLATFVLAARAAGSTAPLSRLVPLMVLALVVMAVPLSVGGWGPREGICAWAFAYAGFGAELGLTVAVVYGLFALVASLPGVPVLVMRVATRRRLPVTVG